MIPSVSICTPSKSKHSRCGSRANNMTEVVMKMPDLSTTDSVIKLVRWLVQPGQTVKRGQPLCEIETDKAASEVESIVAGVLKEFRAQPGDMVVVGQEIALFETESASAPTPATAAAKPASTPAAAAPAPVKGS